MPNALYDRNLLLLEDDEDLADYISACLEDAGYAVRHATDGLKGLSAMREELPDLVVSDVMMPGMGWLEFLTTVRANPRLSSITLVFLTTQSRLTDIVGGLELGADDYLVKPFKPEELVARVHSKMTRVPVPVSELRREHACAKRGGYAGTVARLVVPEIARLRNYLGPNLDRAFASQLGALLSNLVDPLASVGRNRTDRSRCSCPRWGRTWRPCIWRSWPTWSPPGASRWAAKPCASPPRSALPGSKTAPTRTRSPRLAQRGSADESAPPLVRRILLARDPILRRI